MDGKFISHHWCHDKCFPLGCRRRILRQCLSELTNSGLHDNLKCTAVAHKGWGSVRSDEFYRQGLKRCHQDSLQIQGLTLSSTPRDLRNFWTHESHSLAEKLNELNYPFTFNQASPETLHLFNNISLHLFPNLIFHLLTSSIWFFLLYQKWRLDWN